jgi:hypothetical protein
MSLRGISMIAVAALTLAVPAANANGPEGSPQQLAQQLIKDVVFNELADHRHHGYFEYLDAKRSGQETTLNVEVETGSGRIHRMLADDGKPLSSEQADQESRRLEALIHDSSQQRRLLRDYQGDEDRIARIVGLMPEGFLYQFDGVEGGDIRLKYGPNPDFKPPTYEARVFHCMAGTVWINAREKRLSRLQGQLVCNVDLGYGILGRLDKGGSFDMERVEVAPGNWKTRVLDVHITGHVILLKSIAMDQTERRSNFRQVPANTTLAEAGIMLEESVAATEIRSAGLEGGASNALRNDVRRASAAMALK